MRIWLELDGKKATYLGGYNVKHLSQSEQLNEVRIIMAQYCCIMPTKYNITHVIHNKRGFPPVINNLDNPIFP